MQPVNKIGNGEHICEINNSRTLFIEKQRQKSIDDGNHRLLEKIHEIMHRKNHVKVKGVKLFVRPSWQPMSARV